jgi:hypothetical protein
VGASWLDTASNAVTFTYDVTGDEYTVTTTSSTNTFTSGPNKGVIQTIIGEQPLNGVASENTPHVLIEYNSQPTLQTWTFSSGIPPQNAYCSANRVLTKVKASDATN